MVKSLSRKVKVGVSFAMATQPFNKTLFTFGAGTLNFMSGDPYGPRGILSDFGGGEGEGPHGLL